MTLLINNTMIISASLLAFSFAGMAVIIFRHLKEIRMVARNEAVSNLNFGCSLVKSFYCSAKSSFICFWKNYLSSLFYKITEKMLFKLEKITKKIQVRILRFSNYIRGRRKIRNSLTNSEYWGDVIEFKNGLNGNGNRNGNGNNETKTE